MELVNPGIIADVSLLLVEKELQEDLAGVALRGVERGCQLPSDVDGDICAKNRDQNRESISLHLQLAVVVGWVVQIKRCSHVRPLVPLGKAFVARTPCPQLDCVRIR